jgi:hypothetical protein
MLLDTSELFCDVEEVSLKEQLPEARRAGQAGHRGAAEQSYHGLLRHLPEGAGVRRFRHHQVLERSRLRASSRGR